MRKKTGGIKGGENDGEWVKKKEKGVNEKKVAEETGRVEGGFVLDFLCFWANP